jgi:formylglycine-generating enzyme required for sulfatase activity
MGGPGSGKTTFLNFVALCLAGEILRAPGANLQLLRRPIPPEGRAPRSRSRSQSRSAGGTARCCRCAWSCATCRQPATARHAGERRRSVDLHRRPVARVAARYAEHLQAELLGQGGLILLDGLDEVPDALQSARAGQDGGAGVRRLYRRCRFLVTSRTYAYQRQDWKLDGFAERELLPFTRGQVERFIDGWYHHMAHDLFRISEAQAESGAAMLKRATERPELHELAARPLLLTLMARLQTRDGGALPENREELYRQSVAMLLDEWEGLKQQRDASGQAIGVEQPSLKEWLNASRENIRRQLDKLAYEAQRQQPTLVGTADIRQGDLIAALLAASHDRPDVRPIRLEDHLRDRTGLLTAHGEGLYQFPHRSFQEYLAACHLARFQFPDALSALAKADPNRWREVTLLCAAGFRNAPGSIWELVDALCTDNADPAASAPEADNGSQWGALLAGQVLHETGLAEFDPNLQPRHEIKRRRVRDWQLRLLHSTRLPARERALAGDLLAALGDTRQHLLDVDRMRFACVPRGPFWMGQEGDGKAPLHRNETLKDDYWIAVAPVTVAQFAPFVATRTSDAPASEALHHPSNRPVVEVSWHEARAFCDWLSERWRDALPAGWSVGLPSEAEWEKAARGGVQIPREAQYRTLQDGFRVDASTLQNNPEPQRAWPWGDEWDAGKSNAENSLGETSTPGCFEMGCSPYGCEDLAGNVWEWTRSLWGTNWGKPDFVYPYDGRDLQREDLAAPDDIWRVLRGGSWFNHRGSARCACRDGDPTVDRNVSVGFRVVLRSSPVR